MGPITLVRTRRSHVARAAQVGATVALPLLVASAWGSGCGLLPGPPPIPRDVCGAGDSQCLLDSIVLTENGQDTDFWIIPPTALATPDGGIATTGAPPPEVTSGPPSFAFDNGNTQSLDIAFDDPTGSQPSFIMTLRPHGADPLHAQQCFGPCCWGCRATRRVFDHRTSGTVHYQATTLFDPPAATTLDGTLWPVSCAESGADPADYYNAGGATCTPITGAGIQFSASFAAATNPGNPVGGGNGGSSGSGGGSSGGSSGCTSDSQCACNAVCGPSPGAPNNGGVCDTSTGLCHCCYLTCGIDSTGAVSNCSCIPGGCPSSSQNCLGLSTYTCVGSMCSTIATAPSCGP
jgi:hypothetical protein